MLARLSFALLTGLGLSLSSLAAEVRILAPNAARQAVSEAITVFEKSTQHTVVVTWSGTEAISKRVAEGEVVDLVVNTAHAIDRQSREGKLIASTRTDFARSGIGTAIPATRAKIDVSNTPALTAALLAANAVVVSSGTSGRHMVEMFAKLGIGEQLREKTRQPPSGAQIADFLVAGNADIGFQQISELMHAPGIHYLGPLPADLQNYTVYSAAMHAGAANAEAAKVFLAGLRSLPVRAAISASGMEAL